MNKSGSSSSVPPQRRFPFRLHEMLEDSEAKGVEHIISWMPCGTLFKIHNHKEFTRIIMPKYCRHSRYKSFLRQLSMYKFQRINEGPKRGCYHHPNFQRGRFDLIEFINRKERDGPGDYAPKFEMANNNENKLDESSSSSSSMCSVSLEPNDTFLSSQDKADDDDMMMVPLKGDEDFELVNFDEDYQRPPLLNRKPSPYLTKLMKNFYLESFPMVNSTPDDILQEIISTFSSHSSTTLKGYNKGFSSQEYNFVGQCA